MADYGIGRVPADVDGVAEAMASLEAAEIMAEQATVWEQRVLRNWQCCERDGDVRCPETHPNLTIWRSGTPGCAVMCERHWLEYHRSNPRIGPEATVEQVLAYYRDLAQQTGRCAVCGQQTNNWVSGAGRHLCTRHQDNY